MANGVECHITLGSVYIFGSENHGDKDVYTDNVDTKWRDIFNIFKVA